MVGQEHRSRLEGLHNRSDQTELDTGTEDSVLSMQRNLFPVDATMQQFDAELLIEGRTFVVSGSSSTPWGSSRRGKAISHDRDQAHASRSRHPKIRR
ncbi:MAG: hypothetical protein IPI82_08920 [Candidatus Microthrix sp.]|nr:hypothetical protein [Candidatus Microthrix sp.]MBK7322561.1 hypothetical protein [Candidatus Microthrix sp.]